MQMIDSTFGQNNFHKNKRLEAIMNLRQIILSISFIAIIFVVLSLYWLSPKSVAQTGGNCGDASPDALGMHYTAPSTAASPKITMEQAIQVANKNSFVTVDGASTVIRARYVIFSDDVRGTADKIGDDASVRLNYQNVPAWVVTYCGLSIPPAFRRGVPTPTKINYAHEWNVVINAETGEYMEEFSFR
jgi:hypothetical protein